MNHPLTLHPVRGLVAALVLALIPLYAHAERTVMEGVMNGLQCAIDSEWCPIDKLDPHIAFEPDFVLQRRDGEFFLLPNLPRDVKVRYVLENARVTGELRSRRQAIMVDKLEIGRDGTYRTVWSQALHREMLSNP